MSRPLKPPPKHRLKRLPKHRLLNNSKSELAITPDLILIQTTVDSMAVADVLMKCVIDERVAACAALSASSTSHYRWQGRIETSTEWCLTFKTRRELFDRVAALIRTHHPYEVPEIIAIPILEADSAYAGWVVAETASD